ncbi:putative cytochrome P450 [Septoria linicola]|nr:putative cytochrome P450 [Septoria linicola]
MALTLYLAVAAAVAYVVYQIYLIFADPLKDIPGPPLARITSLQTFYRFYCNNWHEDVQVLHKKYGPVVRIAPGHYSFATPEAIKPIHGWNGGFDKSSYYEPWSPPGTTSLFKERSNKFHGDLRKRFSAMYGMSSVYAYETGVAECVDMLMKRLEKSAGTVVDLSWEITCMAFDSIGVVTYNRRFGFLDRGEDIGNLSKSVYAAFTYGGLMGFYPDFHAPFIAIKRWIARQRKSKGSGKMYLDNFTSETTTQRREARSSDPTIIEAQPGVPTSILDKFLDANERDPVYFTDAHITMGLGANVTAGSDTTSTTLTWAFYNLIRNPSTLARLRSELSATGTPASQLSFRTAQSLPYLNAVIDETLRLFPQTGFGLPRVVPVGGATICNYHFPAGSTVSMNAWAMHYNSAFFPDAQAFKPERWLESDKATKETMQAAYFPFGLGSRTCIGKNIASLVILKALPQLVERFDVEVKVKDGQEKLPVQNIFLVRATEFPAVVKVRGEEKN